MKAAWHLLRALVLAVPTAVPAAPLQDLATLPVRFILDTFSSPANAGRYWLSADTGLAGTMQPVRESADLLLYPTDGRRSLPGLPRFTFKVHARATPPAELLVNLTATNQRCMLTTIDPQLMQASRHGRLVTITPRMTPSDRARLPQVGGTTSICTDDSGHMTIFFSPPAFDMVEMVVLNGQAPDAIGKAAYFVMLPLPTNPPTAPIRP